MVTLARRRYPQRTLSLVKAQEEGAPASSPVVVTPPAATETAAAPSERQKGQGLALVTGGISLLISFAYFALVFVMDTGGRGLPPPPEALIP